MRRKYNPNCRYWQNGKTLDGTLAKTTFDPSVDVQIIYNPDINIVEYIQAGLDCRCDSFTVARLPNGVTVVISVYRNTVYIKCEGTFVQALSVDRPIEIRFSKRSDFDAKRIAEVVAKLA